MRKTDTVDSLEIETIELNQELLKLDLAVAALTSEAEAAVEYRTVYNFVNVPIGTDDMLGVYADANVEHSDDADTGELAKEPYDVADNEHYDNSDYDPSDESIDQEYSLETTDQAITKSSLIELRKKKLQKMRRDYENDITSGVRTLRAGRVYNHQDFWAMSADTDH